MLNIRPVPAFDDNYIWLFTLPGDNRACVVDPGDAGPVEAALAREGLELEAILVTHHHFDHVGGLERLKDRYDPHVFGPHNPAIAGIDTRLADGETARVLGTTFRILAVPGHTLDHIAYFHAARPPALFCGDTLFAGGCGRLFEGDAATMYASLRTLAALPGETRVYCAHEYTLSNLKFARAVEPDNGVLARRQAGAERTRARGEPTVPSTLAEELATNPFLRCTESAVIEGLRASGRLASETPEAVFAAVRSWKDNF